MEDQYEYTLLSFGISPLAGLMPESFRCSVARHQFAILNRQKVKGVHQQTFHQNNGYLMAGSDTILQATAAAL